MPQYMYADRIVSLVRLQPEAFVRLDDVERLILQLVRPDLVREADSAPLLVEIQQHAAPLGRHALHRRIELGTAITPRGVEDVARQASRVDADEDVLAIPEIPLDERDMCFPI